MSDAKKDDAALSADASPSMVDKRNKSGAGVRKVNNKPVLIAIGLLVIFLMAIGYVMYSRKSDQADPNHTGEDRHRKSSESAAREIAGDDARGLIPAYKPQPLKEVTEAPKEETKPVTDAPKPEKEIVQEEKPNPELEELRRQKRELERKALFASTGVSYDAGRDMNRNSTNAAIDGTGNSVLDDLQKQFDALENGDGSTSRTVTTNSDVSTGEDRWSLNSERTDSKTPYTLRAGYVIPAVLLSGINSELPGQITAQVSQNVFDTKSGRYLLVPKGSRLIGTYVNQVQYGQSRVLVAWQRIVFPDATALDIGEMPGADAAGYGGFTDKVDNHYLRIFGSALLLSGITAGVTYSQDPGRYHRNSDDRSDYSDSASDVLSQSLGQVLGQTISQMIDKNINIAPTLEVRPGYQFNVTVTKDISFSSPYSPQ